MISAFMVGFLYRNCNSISLTGQTTTTPNTVQQHQELVASLNMGKDEVAWLLEL
jgi:hypothetical protein